VGIAIEVRTGFGPRWIQRTTGLTQYGQPVYHLETLRPGSVPGLPRELQMFACTWVARRGGAARRPGEEAAGLV